MVVSTGAIDIANLSPRASDDDLDLVERHRHGDPAAFEELFERYQRLVYGIALRMSGNRETAADLSQEIFLRIHRHLARFEGRSSLETWVYRVTINCCRSRLSRRRPKMQALPDEAGEVLEELRDHAPSPERRAIARDTGRRLSRAIAELPAVFREAVVLRDVEGLSYREIAAVLEVRVGTVRSRIARGRERLRELLEAES
ncbi:MAG: sigma-70 family RNA polymerase sigma factor [Thermoanaerobaculia bacterium]|nr:sigma-70 family RNA polymerase sigma factor [Thermoanaerobaculia bacterium]